MYQSTEQTKYAKVVHSLHNSAKVNQMIDYYQDLPPLAQNQALEFLEFLYTKQKVSKKTSTWEEYLKNRDISNIPTDFMENREQPQLQTRSML